MTTEALVPPVTVSPDQARGRLMYRDAAALVGTAGLTAGVGVVFWGVAARLIPASRLGVDTALISLITATASACAVGVGNAFTALLPVEGPTLRERVWQGYRIVLGAAVILGTAAALIGGLTLHGGLSSTTGMLAVVASVVVWSLFVVQDSALTGMGRAVWLPYENVAVSLAKLGLLIGLVTSVAHPAVLSTVLPSAVAVVVVSGFCVPLAVRRRLAASGSAADPTVTSASGLVRASRMAARHRAAELRMFALRDGCASALSLGALMLLPFVVTAVAGPGEGAVFGICISLTQGLDLISAGMGVSLTVHAADRPDEARELALRVWRRVAMVVLVAALALAAASPLVLRIFGTAYVDRGGVTVITVLAATSVIRTGFIIWASLQRALRNTGLLLALNSVVAATMLPLVILLAHAFGAVGAASGVAVAQLLLSVFVFFHLKSTRSR